MIVLGVDERQHKITSPKKDAKRLMFLLNQYLDPEKTMGYSRKKKKFVLKYPRRTYWKYYFMKRPHLRNRKKLNKRKQNKKYGKKEKSTKSINTISTR